MGSPELVVALLWAVVAGGIGAAIGSRRGRTGFGLVTGSLIGPIGWLIVLLLPSGLPKCHACKGDVIAGATKCKNCGSDLKPA
jgi:hypothetical protein